jgi:hypothetical protein
LFGPAPTSLNLLTQLGEFSALGDPEMDLADKQIPRIFASGSDRFVKPPKNSMNATPLGVAAGYRRQTAYPPTGFVLFQGHKIRRRFHRNQPLPRQGSMARKSPGPRSSPA